MHAHERGNGCAGRQILTHRRLSRAHRAVKGRDQHGVRELLSRQLELGAPLHERGLAVEDFFERVVIAAFRDAQVGLRGVVLGSRDEVLLEQLRRALACEPRLVQHRARLPDDRRLLGIDLLVGAGQRQAESRARLLQRGLRLLDAQRVVGLLDPRDHLSFADARAQIDRLLDEPAWDLDAEDDGVVGGQCARRRHGARDALLDGLKHLDGARRRRGSGLLGRGRRCIRLLGAAGGGQHDGEQDQPGAGHPADDTRAAERPIEQRTA